MRDPSGKGTAVHVHRAPRHRPRLLASLLPALLVVALTSTGSGPDDGPSAPVVDITVTSGAR